MLAPRDKLWAAPDAVVVKACEMLQLRKDDVLGDFGCGDGPALFHSVEAYGCRAVGYEIHEPRAKALQDTVQSRELDSRIRVHCQNALDAEMNEGITAVYLYLIERGLGMILPLLRRLAETNGGSLRVVTVLYRIPGVQPLETVRVQVSELVRTPVYRYSITPLSGLEGKADEQAQSKDTSTPAG